jgi:transcriptional regulator with XRE-family HTH domain
MEVKMKKQKSLRQLAKELEISPAYLSMILSGQRKCPPELNEKIGSITIVNSSQKLRSDSASQAKGREFESRHPLQDNNQAP